MKRTLAKEALSKQAQQKEHLTYLWFIGVSLTDQNKGIGSKLLRGAIEHSNQLKTRVVNYREENDQTTFQLELPPHGSMFVVFNSRERSLPANENQEQTAEQELTGPGWFVSRKDGERPQVWFLTGCSHGPNLQI
ncbi:MAG: hypothetical protein AB2L20_18710 [Mangrovibacterium sp.]